MKTLMTQAAVIPALLLFLATSGGAQGPWTTTTVPTGSGWSNTYFSDVVGIDAQNAWAVGRYTVPSPPFGTETHNLAMHWNGGTWTHVATPSPSIYVGAANNHLHAVDALGPNDVWAGGERYGNAGGLSVGSWIHVVHWDGTGWSEIPAPAPPGGTTVNFSGTRILEVLALSPNDVWFGGQWGSVTSQATLAWTPLAMHWDGSSLTVHPTPLVYDSGQGFRSVDMSALGPNDIWAVCNRNSASGSSLLNVILHWDGSSWSQVPVPNGSVSHTLRSIEAISPTDIRVYGEISFSTAPYILHYDGNGWTEVMSGPSTRASHAFGANDVYAAKATISHHDGTGWSTVASFPQFSNPTFFGLDDDGTGGLWAVGRHTSGGLSPLVAHMAGAPSAAAAPRYGCLGSAPPLSLGATSLPVLGQTLTLVANDPTNAAQLTPWSTLGYMALSLAPDPATPCGTPIGGMGVGSSAGEALIDATPTSLVLVDGPVPWGGPALPPAFSYPVPSLAAFAGFTLHAQGVLVDITGPSAPGVLTHALELTIGL